jgi:hypothetical protein
MKVLICPSGNQASVQKQAEEPSPSSTCTELENMAVTIFSGLEGSLVQGGAPGNLFCHAQPQHKTDDPEV